MANQMYLAAAPVAAVPGVGPITHVIFDMDGLLLNTESMYSIASETILARYGKKFTYELKAQMMGRRAIEASQILVDAMQIPMTAEEYHVEREAQLEKLFPQAQLLPGVERLVRHLHAHGIPMAVATGSSARIFKIKTSQHTELFSLFHHIVTSDDPECKHSKPQPDIFLLAMKRFAPAPTSSTQVLVFEDAPLGVQAAINANMPVVMIPDLRVAPADRARATLSFDSMADFDPGMVAGLPAYSSAAGAGL
ncbi:haloacid dehalogenase-like hydrolase [Capsaspora owczarzaki ATCC 30864]|uniref:Haloacid dehalogenase-like hydrolase n=1 Tax=Capsaspora owczarzaki (strain ATCC 30864) TaxID=595528 RepID=A0A0D2X0L8_CAPO3|nr:haloacid dehalogenase-like hydrolase [Capsaspora owczarzaki ATCC 30864]KJE89284.1 haloacid dehalogenase-like hydrolase [Capsaspora owczarzaki ATCC 30864]|eukprot:XP_004365656.1 haloacid dehalogenase-like hydrolase [Capsaspora owczarzaki ATCC 30864]